MPASSAAALERNSTARWARILLLGALLLGLLRFFRLGHWSLWIDESLTYTDWHVGLEGGEIHNPLGYALIAAAVRVMGGVPDEFALRILPALAGFATIPVTYLAFRRFAGELRSAAAALLVAASSWHVYWSQNARFYTFAQLAGLVGAWLFLAGLRRGTAWRSVVGLLCVALGALFHPTVALLLPALVAAPFVLGWIGWPLDDRARRTARRCLAAACVVMLAGAKWAWDAWTTFELQKGQGESFSAISSSLAHYVKTTGFFVTPVLGAGALCGIGFAWKRRERAGLFVVVVVLAVLLLAAWAAVMVRVSAQYVFFLLPWIALLACLPLPRDPEPEESATTDRSHRSLRGGGAVAYLLVLLVPALATTVLYFTVRAGERPPWKAAYELVWNQRQPGDLVLGMHASVGEYYLSPRNKDLRHPLQIGWLDFFHAGDPEAWSRYPRRAWYVINPEEFLDWRPEDAESFQRMLREECRLVKAFPLYVESRDLSVWVYLRE
jgi:4-amino-4-deoxy-L-arabinose transferase-like glycosyltransferase